MLRGIACRSRDFAGKFVWALTLIIMPCHRRSLAVAGRSDTSTVESFPLEQYVHPSTTPLLSKSHDWLGLNRGTEPPPSTRRTKRPIIHRRRTVLQAQINLVTCAPVTVHDDPPQVHKGHDL
ncbi:hypothetical protein F4860DRAFT_292078 [Xylaria cubensis]|nr:hypothetical protein F4860DRAFT_292078 [Xylaria cubensis]